MGERCGVPDNTRPPRWKKVERSKTAAILRSQLPLYAADLMGERCGVTDNTRPPRWKKVERSKTASILRVIKDASDN
ncbi:hypothetical protein NDU88_002486 [Pleurodeles waltl]|uniref:Uncharacterized protein n=1 Tax=Pleurodeles waltl TaxID=8319 RepID=A0AAV7TLX5_PLEWA|nr:hypothetical protein NDU88_002486 [Pleurodeles waltl]